LRLVLEGESINLRANDRRVRGDETLARLPLRAQDGCEGASFMACAHIEGGEVHSPSVAAIAGAFYASISLFEQDPSRIGFSFEPRL
jgi:hypothetical protein